MTNAVPVSTVPPKRPGLVWVILVFYALGLSFGIVSLYALFSGALRLPDSQGEFYAIFRAANFLGLALSAILATASMIQLFRMRRSAAYFATGLLLVNIAKLVWYFPDLVRSGQGLIGQLVGLCVGFLIACYVWHLRRSGVLK